jgi:ABC-type polysaccharide/polyol phosphate export permease
MTWVSVIKEPFLVAYDDMCFLKKNVWSILVSSLVAPLLYLVAFGYGLGNDVTMGSVPYVEFIIPGIIAMTTLSVCFSSVSMKIMVQKQYYKSFDELVLCPIKVPSIVLGKALIGVMRGMLCCIILIIVAAASGHSTNISIGLVLFTIFNCFAFSFLGVAAGIMVSGHQAMVVFTSLVILPMTFLCGTFFSLDALPESFGYVLDLLPLTHTTECTRAIMLGWDFPMGSLMIISIYCVFFYSVCHLLIKRGV